MELFLFIWLPLCFVVAYVASQKGRSGPGMFFLSLFLSPLIGLLVTIALPDRRGAPLPSGLAQDVSHLQTCPSCKGLRRIDLPLCPHCRSPWPKAPDPPDKKKCPACAEWIQAEAIKCRYCGEAQATPATSAAPHVVGVTQAAEGMGYCPGCGKLRHSTVAKCVYCSDMAPVLMTKPATAASSSDHPNSPNWSLVDHSDRNTGRGGG